MPSQPATDHIPRVDVVDLELKVKEMYRLVAEAPHGSYHFELGRPLAERLGYNREILDGIPEAAVTSFAGVGCVFDLAQLRPGEWVVDLGCGSGMDAWYAAAQVRPGGQVVGVDFTPQQVERARALVEQRGVDNIEILEGHIEALPTGDGTFDCVISNGVVNLAPDKLQVFAEAARVLKPGGRLAIADIVSDVPLGESITCDADLWASCIGGAAPIDDYQQIIESAGLTVVAMSRNPYQFLSPRAQSASAAYGVRSTSILAIKPA